METNFTTIQEHQTPNSSMRRMYTVNIYGNRVLTTVTRRALIVRQWLARIRNKNRYKWGKRFTVGLGVQWNPSSRSNRVATLQLCVGSRCLIFQICRANGIPRVLRNFLSDGRATFVGVRNYSDAELLYRDYKLEVKHVLELGSVAGCRGFSMERLASLVLEFDGVRKSESVGRSEWDQRELDDDQVEYACVDAFISFEIGRKLKV
ncbi:exodeoxyribonuclease I [Ranunculus cassubicifolius]